MAKAKDRKKQLLDELLDEVVEGCKTPEDILGENGILKQLTKGVVERMLQAEMTDHLGYAIPPARTRAIPGTVQRPRRS